MAWHLTSSLPRCWCIALIASSSLAATLPTLPAGLRRQRPAVMAATGSCWNPPCREEIPPRWRKLHDCDRPSKWRELLDEEDCKIFNLHRQDFEDGPGAAIAIAERTAAAEAAKVSEDIRAVSRNYTELVPTLLTMDDFVAANFAPQGATGWLSSNSIPSNAERVYASPQSTAGWRWICMIRWTATRWSRRPPRPSASASTSSRCLPSRSLTAKTSRGSGCLSASQPTGKGWTPRCASPW